MTTDQNNFKKIRFFLKIDDSIGIVEVENLYGNEIWE